MTLNIGSKAPDFKLSDDQGKTLSLIDFAGKKLVLYFYPKDDTPGCTLEACAFRDNFVGLNRLDTYVIGISRDSVKSHQKFKEKYDLNFPLLSDENGEVCKAYDVLKEKNMYGRQVLGVERSTFVLDETGNIIKMWRGVKVDGHIDEILKALQ